MSSKVKYFSVKAYFMKNQQYSAKISSNETSSFDFARAENPTKKMQFKVKARKKY